GVTAEGKFLGAKATLNVWLPVVEGSKEYSASFISLFSNNNTKVIEAGVHVYPALYKEVNQSLRIFTYWTVDGFHKTGCYNQECKGFVKTNKQVTLGASLPPPFSSINGDQYIVDVSIAKEKKSGKWWLTFADIVIGYWPADMLEDFASVVQWGGEVMNTRPSNRHTRTQMGSGNFAESGASWASSIIDLKVLTQFNHSVEPAKLSTYATHPECYNSLLTEGGVFYGGPGLSAFC
ncbi:hypothetical protein SELMODRAFT_45242, partial [Selaginella moellendorffii]